MSRPTRPARLVARLVNEVGPFLLLVCACGAAVTAPTPAAPASDPAPTHAMTAATSAPAPTESFDDLAALGPMIAAGMHEIARKSSEDAVELLRADTGDACLRVAFAAAAPVVAKLVDGNGDVLASLGPAPEGVLSERGPVCVRRGDVVRGAAEGASRTHVRWMAWQAP
jgi:hypothetical protein